MGALKPFRLEQQERVKKQSLQCGDMSTVERWLRQAQLLTSLAATETASVKAFLGKWKAIENRLLQLSALLTELSHLQCLSDNTASNNLLQDIIEALEETRSLAMKCTELTYGGKLHTQSNLDSLSGKLDLRLHDCQLVINCSILQGSPLAISRVSPGSSREATRWTIRDLLAHLQIGSPEGKQIALDSMIRLMADDDKNILMVAGQGAVTTLVHLLDASQPDIRERAAAAICKLALNDSCAHQVVSEGGIAPLVRLLESGSPRAQEKAAAGLQGLSIINENARAVATHGGVPALVEVCRAGTPRAQAVAAGSLRNLAVVEELRNSMLEDGAVPILIKLVTSGTATAQENAAETLKNLAATEDSIRLRIVKDGAAQPLIRFLDCSSEPEPQKVAIGTLQNLAACSGNVKTLIDAGLLPRLVKLLRNGPAVVQQAGAATACHMALLTETRGLLGEAGVVGPLVKMLDAKSCIAQEYAAQALATLLLVEENRKLFLAEDWGIMGLVSLLDTRFQEVGKQFPIAALQALSGDTKCRKKMVTAGACCHLRVLADMDVTGAKRLLDRLVTNKLRSLITLRILLTGR